MEKRLLLGGAGAATTMSREPHAQAPGLKVAFVAMLSGPDPTL